MLLVLLQILLYYSVNRLILMNIFGYLKIENLLFSVICVLRSGILSFKKTNLLIVQSRFLCLISLYFINLNLFQY